MADTKKQNYLHGAAILTFGVVIIKILGAIYKIPMGNILGDEGFGIFNTAYNVYNVFLTIATAGFPVALSRMISAANTLDRKAQAKRTMNVALVTFAVLGFVGSALMLIFPTELAVFMEMPSASQSIAAVAPSVFLCCLLGAYRGYCQGHGNMTPTMVGQVLEVLAKVAVGICLAIILTNQGKSLPVSSAGAIFGVVVGSLAALIYMVYYKKRNYPYDSAAATDKPDSSASIFGELVRIGVPITLGACVMSVFTLIDNKLVLYQLSELGYTDVESSVLYGVYSKAMTLYNLPAAFITPLTISVVPAIASCVAAKKHKESCEIGEGSVRIGAIIALPMGVGLSVLSYPIMNVLYPDSHASGGVLLMYMGIASIFVCLALISNAVLQAHGNEKLTVVSMIVGGIVKIGVNWVLVGNPNINIVGAPIGTLCCYVVMCLMNYIFLRKCMEVRPSVKRMLLRPVISTLVMGAAAWVVYALASMVLGEGWMRMALAMLCSVGVAVVVYLVLIIVTRAVTMEDMKLIPKGEKIARLLHIH
ncbi:MAG: polysaccharide biosynthesis protein [Oscillospiraceae bacterium]|nr:polysaccharide biosynthesis protein [Oscillospiraceae bacterium]